MDIKTLRELRDYAAECGKPIAMILNEAVSEYLARADARPVFLDAAQKVIDENSDLLERLAK